MSITNFETITIEKYMAALIITLNRPEKRNSIIEKLLLELQAALDIAEGDSENRVVVLQGCNRFFCTGMDFQAAKENFGQDIESRGFISLLKRFTVIPRIIICLVDGVAMAGGIGILAASDFVIASEQSQFSLSEALWGMLPSCVLPYLIRRIGFQSAYRMTITTQTISTEEAFRIQLVDVISQNIHETFRKYLLRFSRIHPLTIKDIKLYFKKLWIIDNEMENEAIAEITRLMSDSRVQKNISNYIEYGQFPWDNSES